MSLRRPRGADVDAPTVPKSAVRLHHPNRTMPRRAAAASVPSMLFSTICRWELFRLGVAALARRVEFDHEPAVESRSRVQHLRNGTGALLGVSADVALHRNAIAASWLFVGSCARAIRDPASSQLYYGLSELASVVPVTRKDLTVRRQLVLLGAAAVAVGVARTKIVHQA